MSIFIITEEALHNGCFHSGSFFKHLAFRAIEFSVEEYISSVIMNMRGLSKGFLGTITKKRSP